MDFTELRHLAEQIETECGKAIIGKGEQIRLVLTSLFAGGHVLIDDIPGVGKTTLATIVARQSGRAFEELSAVTSGVKASTSITWPRTTRIATIRSSPCWSAWA